MKLSEAMILGSTMIRHVPYPISGTGEGCAMQCAISAMYGSYESFRQINKWPQIHMYRCCPVCGENASLFRIIGDHLNDTHRWPIDRIAEWVSQFEKDAPESAQPRESHEEVSA